MRAYRLNRIEQLIVLSVASMVQPQDEDFKIYRLHVKDFMNLLCIQDQSKYVELPKLTKGLMMKVIEIKKTHSLLQVAWFSSVEHKPGEGVIEVEFSPKLKPYLLDLNKNFVSYALKQVSALSSKYSIRIYELLKQEQFKENTEFVLSEFRDMIGLDSAEYPRYSNFKQKVLNPACKELKEKTDISFEYQEVKTGRKITSLKFYIHNNSRAQDEMAVAADEERGNQPHGKAVESVQAIFKEKISELEASRILDAAGGNIEKIKDKYAIVQGMSNCKNIVGATIAAIKENWTAKGKKNSWNDYDQRTYDIKELEKKLLGRDDE
jgi:plasmid replication initiation protein